ncbi:Major facilitator superfamily domain containing protein [Naviculisporaceae sp. PSN 640]
MTSLGATHNGVAEAIVDVDDDMLGRHSSEDSPLLQQEPQQPDDTVEQERTRLRPRIIILSLAVIFLAELAVNVGVPAMNAVLEAIICNQLHPGVAAGNGNGRLDTLPADTVDSVCKSADVQSYLAMVRGWQATFESIPGILCAIPYGILADRWGRKPVLLLSALGLNLSLGSSYAVLLLSNIFPVWMVWFSGVFMFLGGGAMIAVAMLYTMLSDVLPVDQRATVFFQFGAAFLTAQTISTPLSGYLLLYNMWLPLIVSYVLMTVVNLIGLMFPETLQLHRHAHAAERTSSENEDEFADTKSTSVLQDIKAKMLEGAGDVWRFVLSNTKVGFMMLSLVFVVLGRLAQELLLQYATKRYHWTWSEAAFLMTIAGVTSMVTLIVIMPAAGVFCAKYLGLTGVMKDVWLIRVVGPCLIFGCLVIALAPNGIMLAFGLVPYAFGSGLPALIRSVLCSLVAEHHIAILNTLIGITESVGVMVASPVLAMSLSLGLKMGGGWIGLPFLMAALFATIVTVIAWTFRPPKKDLGREEVEEDGQP